MQCRILGIVILTLALLPISADAEERFALVIGNSKYTDIDPLRNPANDVRLISKSLRDVKFDVILLQDADYRTMREAVNDFAQKLDDSGKSAVGVFYFAGHGISLDSENWLIPVGAAVKSPSDIRYGTLSANYVQDRMETARNETDIIILDACRNNPFASRGINLFDTRSAADGMTRMEPKGSYIAYSTSLGAVAYDGEGDYSPFAEAFAIEVSSRGLSIDDMMTSVRRRVQEATASRGEVKQRPWSLSSMSGLFYFNPSSSSGANTQVANNSNNVTPQPQRMPSKSAEEMLWERVKTGNTIDDYEFYIDEYPKGQYASVAKYEKKQIKKKQKEEQQASNNTSNDNSGDEGSNILVDALGALVGANSNDQQRNVGGQGNIPQSGQGAIWYDNDHIQWQVTMNGTVFNASTFYPGLGQIALQGNIQGYTVNYGVYDVNGLQIGYGQGTVDDQTHMSVTSYWMNGVIIGSGTFHVNHPPN